MNQYNQNPQEIQFNQFSEEPSDQLENEKVHIEHQQDPNRNRTNSQEEQQNQNQISLPSNLNEHQIHVQNFYQSENSINPDYNQNQINLMNDHQYNDIHKNFGSDDINNAHDNARFCETQDKMNNVSENSECDEPQPQPQSQHQQNNSGEGHDYKGGNEKDKKANRGETKFKQALSKLGMKPVYGINRVTIKRGKQYLLYIDNPEILKSVKVNNSYIVFGEAKVHDPTNQIGKQESKNLAQQVQNSTISSWLKNNENKKQKLIQKPEQISDEGIPPESIKMVMEHCKCDKRKAIEALQKSDYDIVQTILTLTG
ncbi:unnamed protein product [Paramecium sonneborni]|uniref:NAC-A/B domain-containing protein n=1 Tax=Paramecium sonneborni TaxID=65129 RepID=A0A8S1MCT8_9CILI|nr:unnamed protein product [Paramecium sonneborni]